MGRWEFYTRIIEMCDTAKRHAKDFAQSHLTETHDKQEAAMLAFHLLQCQKHASNLAGPRPSIDVAVIEQKQLPEGG